jgi:hypothetical protein
LLEPLADALLLQARAGNMAGATGNLLSLVREAAVLAGSHGFASLSWRSPAGLAALTGV